MVMRLVTEVFWLLGLVLTLKAGPSGARIWTGGYTPVPASFGAGAGRLSEPGWAVLGPVFFSFSLSFFLLGSFYLFIYFKFILLAYNCFTLLC